MHRATESVNVFQGFGCEIARKESASAAWLPKRWWRKDLVVLMLDHCEFCSPKLPPGAHTATTSVISNGENSVHAETEKLRES